MRLRKKMAFVFVLFLVAFLALPIFTGCSKNNRKAAEGKSLEILATFYPLYVMLLNITDGVEGVSVSMLAPPDTGCLHDYQLTTKDMKSLEKCDILVVNGSGMEDFLDKALSIKSDRTIVAGNGFDVVDGNPHIWVSLDGAMYQVAEIAAGLSELDPEHSSSYVENASSYVSRLLTLSVEMHSKLDRCRGLRIVTFHEAFPYFASEFGFDVAAVIEREAGSEPSARELGKLVSYIKELDATGNPVALFAEPQYSSSAAEIIAAETGHEVFELDPGVTGKLEKDAYIRAMEKNLEVLVKALN